ncbi:hypothetical protein GCM10011507_25060 [Edaphobacter acidisoli]|uniref:Uncharacterized protein n=1 Tax=Edaphobacter acidisoli TaxID=2040573 RepID=A0A916RVD3_9BACT|nr:hypothetical protein [Edaphobacter acidisoli]GGA72414.1 hypothetical protein GCM10011507_25060 [Edaphobacter acidisoli]
MKRSVAIASWVLEHVVPEPHGHALTGDLFEELNSGRSLRWYWRQVFIAAATGIFLKSRAFALPLAFSACWSTLFPLWQLSIWKAHFVQSAFHQWSALDWPYSAPTNIAQAILPACTFVWLGLLIYWPLRSTRTHAPSAPRLFGSLSLSLNVLLLAIVLFRGPLREVFSHLHLLTAQTLGLSSYYAPLVLSLLTAILTALPSTRGSNPTIPFTA